MVIGSDVGCLVEYIVGIMIVDWLCIMEFDIYIF